MKMNQIITISRQFSSGGREVAKRLADALEYEYYDKEIIHQLSQETGFSESFIMQNEEAGLTRNYPFVFGRSFVLYTETPTEQIVKRQVQVLNELARKGNGIFVGRCADYVLDEWQPLKVYIYASDMNQRIERCMKREKETKTVQQIEKRIKKVDKARAKYYEFYTDQKWGDLSSYHLCIDTSKISIQKAVELIQCAALK